MEQVLMQTQNINIEQVIPLISPAQLKQELFASPQICAQVLAQRNVVQEIISKKDKRLLAIVGPCSIHDIKGALDYANRLKQIQAKFANKLFILMRVYFEKPRTTIGWKGLINDPDLNNTRDMSKGLHIARKLLLDISAMDIPIATEMLDPISPQYTADLVTWASIGARTTESQTHREMSSGLSMPVGYKNGTDGGIDVALGAMQSGKNAHSFLGIDDNGCTAIVRTKGNPYGHIILRGGKDAPNYDQKTIAQVTEALVKAKLNTGIVIDCSHANSNKDYRNQAAVLQSLIEQRLAGNTDIIGFMLESNICEGSQKIADDLSKLAYGVSVTDACIDWDTTEQLLAKAYEAL
jgi:3-deoxy-7-phosphoheptulonate synthase